jgi:hypothetical protein
MDEILTYRADGKTGDANRYSLLRKNERLKFRMSEKEI